MQSLPRAYRKHVELRDKAAIQKDERSIGYHQGHMMAYRHIWYLVTGRDDLHEKSKERFGSLER